jgi:hypothetical protein
MNIFKKYSSKELMGKFKACCERFPLTLFFCLCLAVVLLIISHRHKEIISDRFTFFCIYYSATAALLSLSLHLWCEELECLKKRISIQSIVHVLWLGSAIYLTNIFPLDTPHIIGCAASVVLICISVFLLSFFRQKNDLEIWNFTTRLISSFILAFVISLILVGGIDLLLLSFDKLFGANVSHKLYTDVLIVCMTLLAPILFLVLIPEGEKKHDNNPIQLSKFGSGVIHYLFIPLLASYLIILYIYALKITFAWSLPCGWVSWLITTLMIGMIIIIALLYPIQFTECKRYDKFVLRYLPLMVLPLLLLMTIGIIRRFSDYGVTISRIYLIAFNIWCYAVCIILYLSRSKRIWWIPTSFGVIFFLLSVGPQSAASFTRHILLNDVSQAMEKSGIKHRPMTEKEYTECLAKLDSTTAYRIDDKLEYLNNTFDAKTTEAIVDAKVEIGSARNQRNNTISYSDQGNLFNEPINIPNGYTRTIYIDERYTVSKEEIAKGFVPLNISYKVNGNETKLRFDLSIEKMKELDAADHNGTWILQNAQALLYVNSFNIDTGYNYDGGNISGILFIK